MSHDDIKAKFSQGDHKLKLAINVTNFKPQDYDEVAWSLRCGRPSKPEVFLSGDNFLHDNLNEGAVEVALTMYFFNDGKCSEKKYQIQFFVGGQKHSYAKLDLS